MKRLIFLLLLLPLAATSQNYIYEITATGGRFRVLVTDNSREAYPRDIVDYGLLDTASLVLFAYQGIEEMKAREANLQAQIFLAQLRASQLTAAVSARTPLNYAAYAAQRWETAYDGNYLYEVRGVGQPMSVYIQGGQLRRTSNNNVLATVTPQAANWFTATNGGVPVQLYQYGNIWVGRNSNGQIVTLRRQ